MSILRKILNKLSGRSNTGISLEIKFHKETNLYGMHGRLVASSKELGLVNASIRFVFVGITTPPPLSLELFNYIWEEAKAQGYTPQSLLVYGNVMETNPNAASQLLVTAKQRQQDAAKLIPAR